MAYQQAVMQAESAAYMELVDPAFMSGRCRRRATQAVSGAWFETDKFLQVENAIGDGQSGIVRWPLKERKTGLMQPVPSQFLLQELKRFDAAVIAAFRSVDVDNSGSIDVLELQRLLTTNFRCAFSRQVAKVLLVAYDKDGNGNIDPYEFFPLYIRVSTLYTMFEALHVGAANVAGGVASMEMQAAAAAGGGRGDVGGIKMSREQLLAICGSLDWGFDWDINDPTFALVRESIMDSAEQADGSDLIPFVELVRIVAEIDALFKFWKMGKESEDPAAGFRLGQVQQLVYLHFVSRASSF